jgi:hypothetical protein
VPRLAVFVSPHGFGHAARASAIVAALARRVAGLEIEIWTTVPEWFFTGSIPVPFAYRRCECDVGLVQSDALTENLPATVAALERLWGGASGTETEDLLSRASVAGRRGSRADSVPALDAASETKGSPLKGTGGGPGTAPEAKDFPLKEGGGGRGGWRSGAVAGLGAASEAEGSPWKGLVGELRDSGAAAVLCDISPLGLLAARAAGLPSILVENFTWDWIYEGYGEVEPRLSAWASRLRPALASATLRLQAAPVCVEAVGALGIAPVARTSKHDRERVRERLGIAPGRAMVLVSLGGIHSPAALRTVVSRARLESADFVVPGGSEREERRGNLVLLPHRTPIFHPGLVAAADVVVGKLGYSTVAEAFAAGTRYAYVPRPSFRESAVLEGFVARRLPAVSLAPEELATGAWVERLPELLARPRPAPGEANGAEAAAEAIAELL